MYHDTNDDEWVQSGKMTGPTRNFQVHHEEDRKRAESDLNTEDFNSYTVFTFKTSRRADNGATIGWFHNLIQCVGASFDSTESVMRLCQKGL